MEWFHLVGHAIIKELFRQDVAVRAVEILSCHLFCDLNKLTVWHKWLSSLVKQPPPAFSEINKGICLKLSFIKWISIWLILNLSTSGHIWQRILSYKVILDKRAGVLLNNCCNIHKSFGPINLTGEITDLSLKYKRWKLIFLDYQLSCLVLCIPAWNLHHYPN
jgi:hypothetical protein